MASMSDIAASAREANMQTLRRLNSFSRMLANPDVLAERINAKLAGEGHLDLLLAKRFASGGASSGQPWPGLKTTTQKQRERQGFSGSSPLLIRSGLLRAGAVEGKTSSAYNYLSKDFKDGAAPRYSGGGGFKKQGKHFAFSKRSGNRFVVRGGRLSDYAGALNKARPFFGEPTKQELGPLLGRRNELISEALRRMTNGDSLTGFI